MPKISQFILFTLIGLGVFLIIGFVGGAIAFNTLIRPNIANLSEPVANISAPILEEGEQIAQEGIEQGKQESQNIISEIIQANITAVREQLISTFTIGGGEGESEGGE